MLSFELPKPLEKRLQALARKTGRSPQEVAIEAIAEGIEDYEDALIGLDRLKDWLFAGETESMQTAQAAACE